MRLDISSVRRLRWVRRPPSVSRVSLTHRESRPLLPFVTRHAVLTTGTRVWASLVTVHPWRVRYYLRPSVPHPPVEEGVRVAECEEGAPWVSDLVDTTSILTPNPE